MDHEIQTTTISQLVSLLLVALNFTWRNLLKTELQIPLHLLIIDFQGILVDVEMLKGFKSAGYKGVW
ncbi:hypothetical protein C2E44_10925 [Enterobacter ludwigii]|nr:hypothetical protein C2E44_10925 [Enterobacter ludwigii]